MQVARDLRIERGQPEIGEEVDKDGCVGSYRNAAAVGASELGVDCQLGRIMSRCLSLREL